VLDAYEFEAGRIDLYVDALFGAGLSRSLDPDIGSEILTRIGDDPVLSVDIPSGVDGNSGLALGPAFSATRTITFFRRKPGHLLLPGRLLCGAVTVADIGIEANVIDQINPLTFANAPTLWGASFPWPKLDGHKYSRGHVVVVSGPALATGAARLGARAALRIGAGVVTLVGDGPACAINAAHSTAVMVGRVQGPLGLAAFLADKRRNAVLIGPGCGVGPETVTDVLAVLAAHPAVVLDADALTTFAGASHGSDGTGGRAEDEPVTLGFFKAGSDQSATSQELFSAIAIRSGPVVMTPHDGEFVRLFGPLAGSKLERAREAARLSGAIVVLKGADTVIAAPDGRAAINENAPPWLATAGSGDVLAGFVTGLLAQGMPPFEAACAAVWLHGDCARRFGPGLIAEDLPEVLPEALADLYEMGGT
jgi:NAD(P)H-hydrate epimerase